jgi:hypothetical protein
MMMFDMKSSSSLEEKERKVHWTTIYVIITITTMLIESIRIVNIKK